MMKRKLRLSALMVVAVLMLALLIGGLYGAFDDVETSNENTFTVGTLNLVSVISGTGWSSLNERADGINDNVTFEGLACGDSGSITWALTNDGSLDGTLAMLSAVTFAENGTNEPEGAAILANGGTDLGLGECVGVKLQRNAGNYILGSAANYVPFTGLQAVLNAESETLAAGNTITYILEWQIPADVVGAGADGLFGTADDVPVNDNIIQGDGANIDITFTLTQV
jgi:predicted ribosomally synthesized peptide with SipW-like signal peptide